MDDSSAENSKRPHAAPTLQAAGGFFDSGRYVEAEAMARELLKVDPGHAHHWFMLGLVQDARGEYDGAMHSYQRSVEIAPDFFPALCNLGQAQVRAGRVADAVATFESGIQRFPNSAALYHNLSLAYRENWQLADAETAARRSIELAPGDAEAQSDLGAALAGQDRFLESLACYEKAIALKPDFVDAHLNLGLARLVLGQWEAAWPEYEWRLRNKQIPSFPAAWQGEDICGEKILLHGEQGFGDFLNFARYVPLVEARGAEIFLQCPVPLLKLAKGFTGKFTLVAPGEPYPALKWRASLLSLPGIFKTTPASVPWRGAYLTPPLDGLDIWKGRLRLSRATGAKPTAKIGLVWAGRPDHRNDRWRSMDFSLFAPLAEMPNVEFHSLQIGLRADELTAAKSFPIKNWSGELTDFVQTAALISQLDLVIAVDTAVAHLAGAMAKPLWLLLPKVGDWRWMRTGETTPWYPNARLFRQTTQGDWQPIIRRLMQSLQSLQTQSL